MSFVRALAYRKDGDAAPGAYTPDRAADYQLMMGRQMCALREEAGLTQPQVGKMLGVTPQAVCAWETGKRWIAADHYRAYAQIFDLPEKEWGDYILRHTNPWLHSLLHPEDKQVLRELKSIRRRSNANAPSK